MVIGSFDRDAVAHIPPVQQVPCDPDFLFLEAVSRAKCTLFEFRQSPKSLVWLRGRINHVVFAQLSRGKGLPE